MRGTRRWSLNDCMMSMWASKRRELTSRFISSAASISELAIGHNYRLHLHLTSGLRLLSLILIVLFIATNYRRKLKRLFALSCIIGKNFHSVMQQDDEDAYKQYETYAFQLNHRKSILMSYLAEDNQIN